MNNMKCYFCQQVLRADNAEQHAATCGFVLEPCANKCGAYVPRNMKLQHNRTCQNSRIKAAKSSESLLDYTGYDTFPRAANNHKMMYRNPSYSSTYNVDQSVTDMRYEDLKTKFQFAHKQHSDLIRQLEFNFNKFRADMQMVKSQNLTLVDWRTNVQFQLDGLLTEFHNNKSNNNNNDLASSRLQEIIGDLNHVRNVLNSQQLTIKNLQLESGEYRNNLEKKIAEMRAYFVQQLEAHVKTVMEQKKEIEKLEFECGNLKRSNDTAEREISSLKSELQAVKEQCLKAMNSSELHDAHINDLKKSMAQINLDVEVTENSFENIQGLIATQAGRLVWKINDFSLKMDNAKANEKIPIKSPIFYSSDYGYRIRLLVYLNGLKKWRGRYLLARMHVMKGDYDDLLKWPCKIEANVLLRDLDYHDKPKNYVRYITAKYNIPEDTAEDPQESSTQYIFIPHATLLKPNHLKNNAVYLEIIVNNET